MASLHHLSCSQYFSLNSLLSPQTSVRTFSNIMGYPSSLVGGAPASAGWPNPLSSTHIQCISCCSMSSAAVCVTINSNNVGDGVCYHISGVVCSLIQLSQTQCIETLTVRFTLQFQWTSIFSSSKVTSLLSSYLDSTK